MSPSKSAFQTKSWHHQDMHQENLLLLHGALCSVTTDLHHSMIKLYVTSVLHGQGMHGPNSVCSCALFTKVA